MRSIKTNERCLRLGGMINLLKQGRSQGFRQWGGAGGRGADNRVTRSHGFRLAGPDNEIFILPPWLQMRQHSLLYTNRGISLGNLLGGNGIGRNNWSTLKIT